MIIRAKEKVINFESVDYAYIDDIAPFIIHATSGDADKTIFMQSPKVARSALDRICLWYQSGERICDLRDLER